MSKLLFGLIQLIGLTRPKFDFSDPTDDLNLIKVEPN